MTRAGRQVPALAGAETHGLPRRRIVTTDLQADRAGQDAERLLLHAMVLGAQRLAGANVQDLPDVAVGARPDDLVSPRLRHVLGARRPAHVAARPGPPVPASSRCAYMRS